MNFPLIDWWKVGANLLSVAAAYLLAMPVAWEREHNARTAGLRTFPLVAMASCGYMLLATSVFSGEPGAVARIVQGLMTGIGFEVRRERLDQLRRSRAFLIVSEVGLPEFRPRKTLPALVIILGVAAAAGLLPVVVAAIAGCVLLILTRCLTIDEAYQAVEWRIIFLLAGVLTLGVAMEKSGAARLMSDAMITVVGGWGPAAGVSGLFLLTTLLTNVMSNNATAALLTPIAIVTAESLALSPRPFLMAVTFAASLSFMTPVGYQTNTLIYGPGQYRFMDFVRVGTPLNLLFWLPGTFLIPLIWAF